MSSNDDIRRNVREKYGSLAVAPASSGCCGSSGALTKSSAAIGYTAEQTKALPEGANLGLGCGNPLQHAAIQPGETILDLGSGAGIDVFLAARETGPTGRAIGVDMTPEMIERARKNAEKAGVTNADFRLGEIERLPVADAAVDVIISNCVVNLSPDKPAVFAEAFRVLKPGGRLLVSDIVLNRELPEEVKKSVEAYVGCVAGASLRDDYLGFIRDAGFKDVEIVQEDGYGDSGADIAASCCGPDGADTAVSVKVRAIRP